MLAAAGATAGSLPGWPQPDASMHSTTPPSLHHALIDTTTKPLPAHRLSSPPRHCSTQVPVATWINTPEQLDAYRRLQPQRIGLDTEFIRERTYWPQLALVQMAIGEHILLIDPLQPGMAAALRPWLEDTSITKIMHSASEDLVAFQHACGAVPRPLFDTQIAAALAGIGAGMGYQKLVAQVTGVELEKGEQRSDWMRRPLSDSQLHYAAADVIHLFALHDHLSSSLQQQQRIQWQMEDANRLVDGIANDTGERWPHLSMRAAQFLDTGAQQRLLRLLRWRDAHARSSDKPRSWILDNELACSLAKNPPASAQALDAVLERNPKAPRKLAAAIWQALSTPLADEALAPLATDNSDRLRAPLKRLQQAVAAQAAEIGLPDGVLASRKQLEAWLELGQPPASLTPWRRQLLQPLLTPLLP